MNSSPPSRAYRVSDATHDSIANHRTRAPMLARVRIALPIVSSFELPIPIVWLKYTPSAYAGLAEAIARAVPTNKRRTRLSAATTVPERACDLD
jgi:hypothetical protein